ncbi:MAG TPA: chromosomal replication initiator protein DnaA [Ktedonobacteraceae bacterium]
MKTAATIWRTALERLEKSSVDLDSKSWLQDARLLNLPPGRPDQDGFFEGQQPGASFILQVSSDLARDVISARWQHALEQLLQEITGQTVLLTIATDDLPADFGSPPSSGRDSYQRVPPQPGYPRGNYNPFYDIAPKTPYQPELQHITHNAGDSLEEWDNEQRANILMHNRLNPRYTFDAFIVGNSNRLAHAASLAVAEAPGESYNPLFLYGGVGLGKTHLLHAIGHQGVQTGLAVLYVSSEQFTNEIINAIRYRTTEEFRAKYRSVDILLVDDIQFIAGKESTEEEFFHTFNSLHEMSKQIVICSDRPPKAIVSLEERLRSRFEWGLIADIQPPDLETRMAILRVKADLLRYRVPDDIISYIAGRVQTNIRELEGCLNRLMAYQQLHRTELTMDVARAAMSSLGNDVKETRLSSRQIAEAVAEYYRISLDAMCGKQRDKHIVVPRQIAMYLIRQETQASLLEIGQLFGGRDHSTVLHACEKIERSVNLDPALRREVIAIREQLMRD